MPQALGALILEQVGAFTASELAVAGSFAAISAEVVGTAVTLGATIGLQSLLAPSIPDPSGGSQSVKQTIPYAIIGYGRCRIAGAFMLDEVDANVLYRVYAFCIGRIDGFEQLYLNDDKPSVVDGVVQTMDNGAYPTGKVKIEYRLGLPTETDYSSLVSELPQAWSSDCRGDGIASYYLRCQNGQLSNFLTQFPNGKPQPSHSARLLCVYDWRDEDQNKDDPSTWAWSRNPVICWVNDLWQRWGYDWDICFAPVLDDLAAQADICDETVSVKNLIGQLLAKASASDTSIQLSKDSGLQSGIDITLGAGTDDEETVTVSSVAGSSAPYTVNLSAGLSNAHAQYEKAAWVSDSGSPATEPRYTCDGFYTADAALADVVLQFRTCCDGWMCRDGNGAVVIKVGKYEEPTIALTVDDIIDYDWSSYVPDERATNQLNVSFCSPEFDFAQVDTDPWSDSDDISARGQTLSQSFYPKWCGSNSQARRLAKRALSRMLAGSGTINAKLSGLKAVGSRYIRIQAGDYEADELNDVVVEVVGDVVIAANGLSVSFPVAAADANIDSWNYLTEEGDGPIAVSRLIKTALTPPTITSVTPFFDTTGSGDTLGVRLTIEASGPDRDDLSWASRWRVSGATSWVEANYPSLTGAPDIEINTDFVTAYSWVDVEVAYLTGGGALSDWSASTTIFTQAGLEDETDALVAAITAPPSADWIGPMNVAIKALKDDGLWSKADLIYFTAAPDSQAAKLNWKAPGTNTLTASGGLTYAMTGVTGNGSTGYLDTGINLNALTQFQQNSASLAVYCATNGQENIGTIGTVGGNTALVYSRTTGNQAGGRINDTNGLAGGTITAAGLAAMNRTGASARQAYINGSSVTSDTQASAASASNHATILRDGSNYSAKKVAFAWWGASLTSGEHATLNSIVTAYLSSVPTS